MKSEPRSKGERARAAPKIKQLLFSDDDDSDDSIDDFIVHSDEDEEEKDKIRASKKGKGKANGRQANRMDIDDILGLDSEAEETEDIDDNFVDSAGGVAQKIVDGPAPTPLASFLPSTKMKVSSATNELTRRRSLYLLLNARL